MQHIHGILGGGAAAGAGGSGGRIFGDRRLRATAHGHHHHHQQALKCPRCDSLNTKFCYYNNYNLSQPRHFCKNCRRYWTKGGVLRNVPVGGGCRKSKRSSNKRKTSSSPPLPAKEQRKSNSQHSSSESTSANTGNRAQSTSSYADVSNAVGSGKAMGMVPIASEAGSEFSSSPLFKFSEQPPVTATMTFDGIVTVPKPCDVMNVSFDPLADHPGTATADSGADAVFTEIGGFGGSMIADQHQGLLGFAAAAAGDMGPAPFRMHQQNQVNNHDQNNLMVQHLTAQDWHMEKMDGGDHWGPGVLNQTVQVDVLPNSRTGGVLAGTDWQGVSGGGDGEGHLGLYELTPGNSVVHHGHWSQPAQWPGGDDHHLYLPP